MCIALLELKPVANEAYAPPPGAVGADTPLSQKELDAAVKAAAVQVAYACICMKRIFVSSRSHVRPPLCRHRWGMLP